MNNDTHFEVTSVREHFIGFPIEFKPCAFFDERLDCIRVIARDCSVLEERVNDRLTILIDNHPADTKKYIGFTLKGARHFCNEYKLSLTAPLKLASVADAILQAFPDPAIAMLIDMLAKALIIEDKIEEIEIPADMQLA